MIERQITVRKPAYIALTSLPEMERVEIEKILTTLQKTRSLTGEPTHLHKISVPRMKNTFVLKFKDLRLILRFESELIEVLDIIDRHQYPKHLKGFDI